MAEGLKDILDQLKTAQDTANAANEKRYQEILGSFAAQGAAGEARISQATQKAQAKSTQDLTARGLGSTTVTGAMSRGIASDAELMRQQLQEGVSLQKAGVMERRTDEGPDLGLFANLMQMYSQQGQGGRRSITTSAPSNERENWGFPRRPSVSPASEIQSSDEFAKSPPQMSNIMNDAPAGGGWAVGGQGPGRVEYDRNVPLQEGQFTMTPATPAKKVAEETDWFDWGNAGKARG